MRPTSMPKNVENGRETPCVHFINRRISHYKRCIRNYECFHCLFDQWLDATETSAPAACYSLNCATAAQNGLQMAASI